MGYQIGDMFTLVGIGRIDNREYCVISGTPSTGYIEHPSYCGEMLPVNLSLFGPGMIGEKIELIKTTI